MGRRPGTMLAFAVALTVAPPGRALSKPVAASDRAQAEHATDRALWVAATGGRLRLGYRAEAPLALGPELGAYPIRRLRVAASLLVAPRPISDGCYPDILFGGSRDAELGYWFCRPSRSARFAFSFSAGVVLVDTAHWVIAPGIVAMRTDVSDYGTSLGISLPIDWQARPGLRLGVELGLGDTFGQHVVINCSPVLMNPCVAGSTVTGPNLFTWSALGVLSVGWAFDLRSTPR